MHCSARVHMSTCARAHVRPSSPCALRCQCEHGRPFSACAYAMDPRIFVHMHTLLCVWAFMSNIGLHVRVLCVLEAPGVHVHVPYVPRGAYMCPLACPVECTWHYAPSRGSCVLHLFRTLGFA